MRVGVLLPSSLSPADLVRLASDCERAGASSIWYPDTRFLRDPFVGLSILAGATEKVDIGTAVTDPYARHPALLATAFASVAELAPGRVRIGIGAGASGLRQLGIDRQRPLAVIRETIHQIRALLQGRQWPANSADPVQMEFHTEQLPIFVGTRSRGMLRVAGELADGVILGHLANPQAIERAFVEIAAAAGGRSLRRVLRLQVIVGGADAARRSRARQVAAWVLRQHVPNFTWLDELGFEISEGLAQALQQVRSPRDVGTVADMIPKDVADSLSVQVEHPEDLGAALGRLPDVDELMLRVDPVEGDLFEHTPALLASAAR